ncbi:hypothetical protein D8674_005465 [Pyrus ussuriensis x Pyrus communis]|uniref:Uncharacterized protein n=1 Tax=Pyrus ussuriensis x Pyrus communis TaxID=2448454 RepID=A0A5N5FRI8_9ROSA|nr:hypothetical protein D8674_005465 [Pyrus ussuriensis x Pyrus communis]
MPLLAMALLVLIVIFWIIVLLHLLFMPFSLILQRGNPEALSYREKTGIWDYISGTTDSLKRKSFGPRWPTPNSVKRITLDVTSAKNLCSAAYGYGARLFSINLQADCIGYKIVARSIRDLNESDKQEVDVKAMQADLRKLKKEFSELRKRHKQVQLDKPSVDLKSPNTANIHSVANQKLMKELDLFS